MNLPLLKGDRYWFVYLNGKYLDLRDKSRIIAFALAKAHAFDAGLTSDKVSFTFTDIVGKVTTL